MTMQLTIILTFVFLLLAKLTYADVTKSKVGSCPGQ